MNDIDDRGNEELERRLRAYAAARLAPDPRSIAPMRAAVIAALARATVDRSSPVIGGLRLATGGSLRATAGSALRATRPSDGVPRDDADESIGAAVDRRLLAWGSDGGVREDGLQGIAPRRATGPRVRRAELIPVFEPPPPATGGHWLRRAAAVLLAAGLVLGGAVAVSAAAPDSPLYGTRLWVESLTLPAAASARAEARVAALQQRIKEAQGAASGGNGKALAAALAAYRSAVKDALTEAGSDPDRLARLEAALGLHVVVLQTIDGAAIAGSENAVGDALAESQKAVTEIHSRVPGVHPSHGPGG